MKHFLLFLSLALTITGCAKSYIELTYNENVIEAPIFERHEGDDVTELRKEFSQPAPSWLEKTAEALGG
jgi:hypothetical protein